MRSMILVLAAAALLLTACSGGDKDGPANGTPAYRATEAPADEADLRAREDDLRRTAIDALQALIDGDAADAYAFFSEDFQDRCPAHEFAFLVTFVSAFLEDADAAEITVNSVRFEGDRAYVTTSVNVAGEEVLSEGDDGSYWTLEDGEWKADTDDPAPCDLDPDAEETATPASGPGSSRSETIPLGDPVRNGDLEVTVLDVDLDAEEAVLAQNDFADPPPAGRRYVLISVRAHHAGAGDETISLSSGDFKLTGSANVLYDGFSDDTSCDFVETISGEMFAGGTVEGDLCFQVPADEGGLILVLDPFFSFEDSARRYLALE
ncbi:MAG: DUF4352 domain-containing protein [Dehalococcoidia bacterium]